MSQNDHNNSFTTNEHKNIDIEKIKEKLLQEQKSKQDENYKKDNINKKHNPRKDFIQISSDNKIKYGKKEYKNGQKSKKEITIFKYSQRGRIPLHEAVIIGDKPYFIKYVYSETSKKKRIELVEKIEETSRILLPPEREEYQYTPYTFDDQEEVENFIQQAESITLDQIYQNAKELYRPGRYIDQYDHIITLLSSDAVFTYFQDLFPFTHYTECVADNDKGKSSIGYLFEYTAYRVVRGISISAANYYRSLGSEEPGQCIIIEDEGDNISEDPEKNRILKSGYEYNGKVPKINMNTTNQGQRWFYTFGYKMFLSEKSLSQTKSRGLQDRTLSFHSKSGKVQHSIKEVVSETINKNPDLQTLYDELLDFRKLMFCYRLVHYTDTLPEIETGLKNRDNELFKPTLQLFAKTKALQEIIPALEVFVNQRKERKLNSLESTLYPIIKELVYTDLKEKYPAESEPTKYPRYISTPLSLLWQKIIGEIEGNYDQNRKQQYETINFGVLYLNTITKTLKDKFGATITRKSQGTIVTFDRQEIDRQEEVYGQLQEAKINVKITKDYEKEFRKSVGNEGDVGYEDNTERVNDVDISNQVSVEPEPAVMDLNNNTDTHTHPTQSCNWCDKVFPTKEEKISHSVNSHPGKPADADPDLLKLITEGA